ncbi:MAG: rhomboid family intramembrane serine protease [Sphingobacteriaceae bacterium]
MEQYLTQSPVASAIFVFTILTSILAFSNERLYGNLIFHPYSVYRRHNVYTVITSGFIHKDWMHLFFNMFSYYAFAFQLESTIGHWQFAVLYFGSLILSDLPSVVKYKDDYGYHSLGASGAVCAVVFSFILFYPLSKMMIIFLPIPLPAILLGGLFLAYTAYAARQSRDGINHHAHFYGALAGVMFTILFYPQIISYFFNQLGLH